jgi:hypothetical protein
MLYIIKYLVPLFCWSHLEIFVNLSLPKEIPKWYGDIFFPSSRKKIINHLLLFYILENCYFRKNLNAMRQINVIVKHFHFRKLLLFFTQF